MTSELEGGEGSASCPGCSFPPGKTRYPYYRSGWTPGLGWIGAENLAPTGIRFQTPQLVASRYTDWATRPIICLESYSLTSVPTLHRKSLASVQYKTIVWESICLLIPYSTQIHFVWGIRNSLTLRWLMSYIYGAPILDFSRSHTTTQHSR